MPTERDLEPFFVYPEAEHVPRRIEHHAQVLAPLMVGESRTTLQRKRDARFQIVAPDLEVHLLVLSLRTLRPRRWTVLPAHRIERVMGARPRVTHDGELSVPVRLLPTEEARVERDHRTGVGAVDADGR